MNSIHHTETYFENPSPRSPRNHQYQTASLHRPQDRHFEAFAPQSNGLYPVDDLNSRFDPPRFNDRMNSTMQGNYGGFDMGLPQAWNSQAYGHNNALAASGATTRIKPSARGRAPLPQMWMDQPQNVPAPGGFPPNMPPSHLGVPQFRPDAPIGPDQDEELIPTAIVIKNIPFAVKKEQLVQLMTELSLPLPYAFNYHFDNGVFRGLAFANFQTPEETAIVIDAMNHRELQGRKLRVEYKKMLPQAERDRIEREKRERRGQLEEQHRPLAPSQLQTQTSLSSMSSNLPAASPSPLSTRSALPNLDMNDPTNLQHYSKLLLFQSDTSQEVLTFPPHLQPEERRVVHGLAHHLGLGHTSYGTGDQRQIHVFKGSVPTNGMSPTIPSGVNPLDANRRGLYRAATTDFTDVRDPSLSGPIGKQSSGFPGLGDAQGGLSAAANLRAAKSFADLRSYTPSPAQSASSFPAGLTGNITRFSEYGQGSPGSSRSNLTPTTTSTMPGNNDALLVNGLNNMSLNTTFPPNSGSPHRLRGMMSWDREGPAPGPIGGHRNFTTNQDESNRSRTQGGPARQPRGPVPDRGSGFQRGRPNGHQQRGSDELSSHNGVDVLAE